VFNPYSGVKTSILFLNKKLSRRSDKILFLKIAAEGFDLGAQRREISANDLPEAERLMQSWFKSKLGENDSSSVAWKTIEKRELLSDKHVVLLAERWGSGEIDFGESDSAPLGEIVEKVSDTVSPSSMPSGTPCVGLEHIGQGTGVIEGNVPNEPSALKSAKVRFAKGDILYGKLRPNLKKVWLASFAGVCSTDFFALRVDRERIEPRLLQFLMLSAQFTDQVLSFVRGAQLPRVSYDDLASIEIPLPSIEEQRRLVAEIESYQKIMDGARQIIDGYQVRLNVESTWTSMALGEVCQFIDYRGKTPEKSQTGIPLITAKNVRWGFISKEPEEFVTDETYKKWMTRGFPKRGDVLFTTEAPLGMAALVDNGERFALAQRIICLSPDPKVAIGGYVFRALLSAPVQKSIKASATGTTVLGIKASSLKEVDIPVPSLEEQRKIVDELDAELAQIEAARVLIPRFAAKIQHVLDHVWGAA
jgi:restriction endonuclease S subunit